MSATVLEFEGTTEGFFGDSDTAQAPIAMEWFGSIVGSSGPMGLPARRPEDHCRLREPAMQLHLRTQGMLAAVAVVAVVALAAVAFYNYGGPLVCVFHRGVLHLGASTLLIEVLWRLGRLWGVLPPIIACTERCRWLTHVRSLHGRCSF